MKPNSMRGMLAIALMGAYASGCSQKAERSSEGADPFGHASSAASSTSWLPDSTPDAAPPPPSAPARTTVESSETSIGGLVTTRESRTVTEGAPIAAQAPPETSPPWIEAPRETRRTPQSGLLTAGDHDDLLNPKAYADYAGSYLQNGGGNLPFVDTRTRRTIKVLDASGRPVPHAMVTVGREKNPLQLTTTSDGTASFYPGFDRIADRTRVSVVSTAGRWERMVNLGKGAGTTVAALPGRAPTVDALDIAIVLDTTGSMGDEMEFIQTEITSIVDSVRRNAGNVDVRIGLVAYRDDGDDYVVKSFPMSAGAVGARNAIAALDAGGGGDTPEAMDKAMQAAERLQWRKDAAKAVLLIADAPPHDQDVRTTLDAAGRMRSKGIQIVPVAASDTDDAAQYVMRAMAVMTHGRYIFLTDDSGVGNAHAEPSVACYAVTRLDQLISRVLAGIVTGRRIEPRPQDVIRTVGDMSRGRCLSEDGGQQ